MKRFYKQATAQNGQVLLDGRPLPTPAKAKLVVPSQALAEAIAAEWQAQGEEIKPETMGLMTLASTAIDRVLPQQADVVGIVLGYLDTDLLAHWAEGPDSLVTRQSKAWQPYLDQFATALPPGLNQTSGILAIAQPEEMLQAACAWLEELDHFALAAVAMLVQLTGSFVLGHAVYYHGAAEAAYVAATVDEAHQAEQWGYDKEAADALEARKREVFAAAQFLELLRKPA